MNKKNILKIKGLSILTCALLILSAIIMIPTVSADSLAGHGNITATGNGGTITDITYDGATYDVSSGDVVTGDVTKYDSSDNPITGGDYPDTGAEDFDLSTCASNGASGPMTYLEVIFSEKSDIFFIYENGGTDSGTIQAIDGGSLVGSALSFSSGTYTGTGYKSGVGNQDVKGMVYTTDSKVDGFRVTSAGIDILSFSAVYYSSSNEAPTITSIPVTTAVVGDSYSYDVDATGSPTPTYSLTTKPATMTIDSNSGVISWTPTSDDADNNPHSVTVEATNTEGTDAQSYEIIVTHCPGGIQPIASITATGTSGSDPIMLTSVTVGSCYTVSADDLKTGTGSGSCSLPVANADNLNLHDVTTSCGTHDIINFNGENWQDTNGYYPDFFIFESKGNDAGTIQAIFPDDSLGQTISYSTSDWGATGYNDEYGESHGLTFAITDLLDASGDPLTNSDIIKGIRIVDSGLDPGSISAVVLDEEVSVTVNSPDTVNQGDTLTVSIDIENVEDFDATQFDLTFDDTLLSVTNVNDGLINGVTVPVTNWGYIPSGGPTDTIRVICNIDGTTGTTGNGYLAEIDFSADSAGTSDLDIFNGLLSDTSASSITAQWYDDSVEILANNAPVVTDIPDQTIVEGSSFSTFDLDGYVSDVEDDDSEIDWTYSGNTDLTVSIDGDHVVTVSTPNSNWNGDETITFTAEDTGGLTDSDTATFTVTAENDPPTAEDDSMTVAEGGTQTILDSSDDSVLDNDDDPDPGDSLTASVVTGPAHASSFTLNPDGTFSYTHDGSETTSDSFEYEADDTNGGTDQATVTITITPVDDPPEVSNPISDVEVDENAADTIIDLTNVFTDPDNDDSAITKAVQSNDNPSLVTASIVGNTLTLDYQADQFGTATIVIRGTSNGKTVDDDFEVTVNEVNNAPNAPSDPSPAYDAEFVENDVDLSWTCSDPDTDPLTYDIYFGTDSNPPLVSTDESSTTYDPGTLDYNERYYWKIVADDGTDTTASPVWSFKTIYPGDANNDDDINANDITTIERIILELETETPGADANQDGEINVLDITQTEIFIMGAP